VMWQQLFHDKVCPQCTTMQRCKRLLEGA
jgi:hypothetical protein